MKLALPNFSRFVFANGNKSAAVERWVFAIGLGCCLLGLVGLLRWGPSDPVRAVRVDAPFVGLPAADVWPYLQEVFGEDLLAVDLPVLATRLEKHPWMEKVQLRRVWPDTLIVDVTEPKPFAHWQGLRGEAGFVTTSGAALEAAGTPSMDLVYQGDAAAAGEFLQWQASMSAALQNSDWELLKLSRSEYSQWRVFLRDSDSVALELRFGEQWDKDLWARFSRAWTAGLEARKADIAYVDLRYRGGMAVGWAKHVKAAGIELAQQQNFDLSTWVKAPQGV